MSSSSTLRPAPLGRCEEARRCPTARPARPARGAAVKPFAGERAGESESEPLVRALPPSPARLKPRVWLAPDPPPPLAASRAPPQTRRALLSAAGAAALGAAALPLAAALPASAEVVAAQWERVELPVDKDVILLDLAFVPDEPNRGFLLGTRQTLLETNDGGRTWEARSVAEAQEEDINYRFNSISFSGKEGWIVGKPAILLHSSDAGATWTRIPLSAKLPGTPTLITALGGGAAEMATDEGAIYSTSNVADTWKAAVEETVAATLNRTVSSGIQGASYYTGTFNTIRRNAEGSYVGVSSRGNFYMTWEPGQAYWQPHNRNAARRIQSMGWRSDGGLWLLTRGGGVFLSDGTGVPESDDAFTESKVGSRGFGLLDIGFRGSAGEAWACGGSGSLFFSDDGGKSWKRERGTDDVPGNLYDVTFSADGTKGFVLGNGGVLLRYINSA